MTVHEHFSSLCLHNVTDVLLAKASLMSKTRVTVGRGTTHRTGIKAAVLHVVLYRVGPRRP